MQVLDRSIIYVNRSGSASFVLDHFSDMHYCKVCGIFNNTGNREYCKEHMNVKRQEKETPQAT